MPIVVYFHHPNLTLEQFDEVDRRVHEATGGAEPEGLIHHSVYGTDGDLQTFEIWASGDAFEAFRPDADADHRRAGRAGGAAGHHAAAPADPARIHGSAEHQLEVGGTTVRSGNKKP